MSKIAKLKAAGLTGAEILELLLDGECAATEGTNAQPSALVGRHCIVRTTGAGVHAGIVQSVDGSRVTLAPGSVRLWRWYTATGKGALSTLARVGIDPKKDNRIERNGGIVTLLDACEIGEVTNGITFPEVWP